MLMLLRYAVILLLIYIAFGLYLYFIQRSFIYLPIRNQHSENDEFELIRSDGESIKIWVVSPGKDSAVIYFGGNAEDLFYSRADFRYFLPKHSIYLVNYRGYSGSTGTPTEKGLFADALNIYDHLQQRHTRISVVGRSLGSGIATYLAGHRKIHRLILVTASDSAVSIASRAYPFYPVSLLLKDRYESTRYAPRITAPTLLLIAGQDIIIPAEYSLNLFTHFTPGTAEKVTIAAAGHNDISFFDQYWDSIATFLDKP